MTMTMTMAEKKMPAGPWGQELVEHLKAAGGGGVRILPSCPQWQILHCASPSCLRASPRTIPIAEDLAPPLHAGVHPSPARNGGSGPAPD